MSNLEEKGDDLMVEVSFRNLQTHRDESLICDEKFDENMSEEEMTRIFKPQVKTFLGHTSFKINSVSEI